MSRNSHNESKNKNRKSDYKAKNRKKNESKDNSSENDKNMKLDVRLPTSALLPLFPPHRHCSLQYAANNLHRAFRSVPS